MALPKNNEAVTINIRAKIKQRDLIDRAAQCRNQNRSEFMMEAASRKAEETLLDHAMLYVNAEIFEAFEKIIEQPLPAHDKLLRLFQTKSPWEKKNA